MSKGIWKSVYLAVHGVMVHEQAHLIRGIVHDIMIVEATSPHAQRVVSRVLGGLEHEMIGILSQSPVHLIHGD